MKSLLLFSVVETGSRHISFVLFEQNGFTLRGYDIMTENEVIECLLIM